MIEALLPSLVLTQAFELPFAWLWGAKNKDLLVVLLMNILTNPLVVMWHYSTWQYGFVISTVLPELAAIVTEAILLRKFTKDTPYPVLLGVFINLFSYSVGVVLSFLLAGNTMEVLR